MQKTKLIKDKNNEEINGSFIAMSTKITYSLFGPKSGEISKFLENETLRLENILSRFITSSMIYKININAGIKPTKVSTKVYNLIKSSKTFSSVSHGLFDITITPLVDLWNYKGAVEPPTNHSIKKAKSLVNYKDIIINDKNKTIFLKKCQQNIDLGGIGKGYIGDEVLDKIKKMGITSAFINIGGNVSTIGSKKNGIAWKVGIQNPRDLSNVIGVVEVNGKSVVTSGDYQRYFFDKEGNRYHHILSPKTGHPTTSGLMSVTVITESGMNADALSTIFFISGIKKSMQMLKKYQNTEAIFVDENQDIFVTKGLKNKFISSNSFKVI